MAGDWIPMRLDLDEDPAVVGIASSLGVSELLVVGCLWKLWSIASRQTVNGCLPHYTPQKLDGLVSHNGFTAALEAVGWLRHRAGSLELTNFDRWMGESAKKRLANTRRQKNARSRNGPVAPSRDAPVTTSPVFSSPVSLSPERNEGCGEKGEAPFSEKAAESAQHWCELYKGNAAAHRDQHKIAAEFQEWLDKLGVNSDALLAEVTRAGRDRTEAPWDLKKRLAGAGVNYSGLQEFINRRSNGSR